MAAYGDIAGVAALVRHVDFGGSNAPEATDVVQWLDARSAQLTAWLAAAGYAVPVTTAVSAEAKAILDRYANFGAAGDVELSLRTGGYSGTAGEDRREERLIAEFEKAEAWISGATLEALGVTRATSEATDSVTFIAVRYRGDTASDEYARTGW